MNWRGAGSQLGLALALISTHAAGAAVTGDLILYARYESTDRYQGARLANARLLGDADLTRALRFHLDVDRAEPEAAEIYEAYVEGSSGSQRFRLGRFQLPFGIYNRSELYYVGLVEDPLIKNYPFQGPRLGRSENGVGYAGVGGPWQVEAALSGRGGGPAQFVPSGGEGSIRVQRFTGSLILGLNALREHVRDPATGRRDAAQFYGLDIRFSRPAIIVRGELVAGHVPGGSPWGYYLDLLYHPVALHRITLVGRTEAVQGQSGNGRRYDRQTVGFKWELGHATALAVNQSFDSPRTRFGYNGTTVYLWYTHRL